MQISITQLYALLREQLGKDKAESLTTYIENKIEKTVSEKSEILVATKQDIADLRQEVTNSIYSAKVDMFEWFLGMFATIVLLIVGLYFKT